jgi:hypothetical protein
MLWKHYENAVRWRVLYLAWTRKGDSAHTVLVTDIPGTKSGTVIGRINDVRLSCFCVHFRVQKQMLGFEALAPYQPLACGQNTA